MTGTPRSRHVDVARLRADLFLNQDQLAAILGVHSMTVSKWERGELVVDPWRKVMLNRMRAFADRTAEPYRRVVGSVLASKGAIATLVVLIGDRR
jgi:putative transcriptional regulator